MPQILSLEGYYSHPKAPDRKGTLTGKIEIMNSGIFSGKVYDSRLKNPTQILRGCLETIEGIDTLSFLKFSQFAQKTNIFYLLRKESNGSFEGKYSGNWKELYFKVEFNEESNLFVASVNPEEWERKESAEIRLYR